MTPGTPLTEAGAEAASYMEDDPEAWAFWIDALERYVPRVPSLAEHIGDDAGALQIIGGSILAYLADQHGMLLLRRKEPWEDQPVSGFFPARPEREAAARVEADLRARIEALRDEAIAEAAREADPETSVRWDVMVRAYANVVALLAATEAPREPISPFPVTDQDLDAPDGTRMMFERVRGMWEPATEDRDEQIERIAAAGDEWRDSLVTDEQAALTKDYLAGKIDRNAYLNRSFPDRATPRPR